MARSAAPASAKNSCAVCAGKANSTAAATNEMTSAARRQHPSMARDRL